VNAYKNMNMFKEYTRPAC